MSQDIFASKQEFVEGLPGLKAKVLGGVLIVTGKTYDFKEDLKSNGFRWDADEKHWTFSLEETNKFKQNEAITGKTRRAKTPGKYWN